MKDAEVFFPSSWTITECVRWLTDRHVFVLTTHRNNSFGQAGAEDWLKLTYRGRKQ